MKKIFLLLLILPFIGICQIRKNVTNQKVNRLIVDGNSLLARGNGNQPNAFRSVIALYDSMNTAHKPPILFYPISGKTITQLTSDFTAKISPNLKQGDIVVCNETTNDLYATRSATLTYAHILTYRDSVRAHGGKLVYVTMPAVYWSDYLTVDTDRLALNLLITNNSSQFDGVVDFGSHANFNDVADTQNTTYYDADRVHFTDLGYRVQGKQIQLIVQSFF